MGQRYAVDVQPSTGYEFKNEYFTVDVTAEDGDFSQAARRGIRRAIERAGEWNAEHPDVQTPRLTSADAYRVVRIRLAEFADSGSAPAPAAPAVFVAVDVPTALAILGKG